MGYIPLSPMLMLLLSLEISAELLNVMKRKANYDDKDAWDITISHTMYSIESHRTTIVHGNILTWQVQLVEQKLLTLPEHLSSPPVFSGVRVTLSLVLCVCFVDRCLSFFFWPLRCLFFFDIRILITPLVSLNSS